ncbi:sensor domain-containing diguanylate cyclase, partial [bacterium]|nr:sensor domain-containing diguanylate cyclase [bacterium]
MATKETTQELLEEMAAEVEGDGDLDLVGHFAAHADKHEMVRALHLAHGRISTMNDQISSLESELFQTNEIISVVKALERVDTLSEKVEIFTAIMRERLESEVSVFFLYWPNESQFLLEEVFGTILQSQDQCVIRQSSGLFWELTCQGEPFARRDPHGLTRFGRLLECIGLEDTAIELFVPLAIGGLPVGLAAFAPRDLRASMKDDYIRRYAAQASASIKTAMLYETNQKAKQDLDRTLSNLKMLYNIGKVMGQISDLKALLQFIVQEACNTTTAERGVLFLRDDETGRLVGRVAKGLSDATREREVNDGAAEYRTHRLCNLDVERCYQTKSTITLNHVDDTDEAIRGGDGAVLRSVMYTPLIVNDECIGVIKLSNKGAKGVFTAEDEQQISAMASQAAVAINRSQLYNLAIKDELTGLYVRRYFTHWIQEEIKRADRYDTPFAVIMIDIDHFKSINDTFGHQVGDIALVRLAEMIHETIRDSDVASRFGGEEFSLLLPEADGENAVLVAERLRKRVESTVIPEMERAMTISMGVACYPKHGK